jgi:hypothetical protein
MLGSSAKSRSIRRDRERCDSRWYPSDLALHSSCSLTAGPDTLSHRCLVEAGLAANGAILAAQRPALRSDELGGEWRSVNSLGLIGPYKARAGGRRHKGGFGDDVSLGEAIHE